ncbi:hypothetical protein DFH06DRAFT_1213086 [Mycena polygramma]|nr:hypothetical protein DFH06DRAFT_1213086 [Mycena polygramma]
MSFTSNSTTSLASTATVSSRAPLTGSTAVPQKDSKAAVADHQSAYGFGGSGLLYFANKRTKESPAQKQKNSSSPSYTTAPMPRVPPKGVKDYEAAFADLQSTYGFSGAVPSPVPKPKENRSLFSKLIRSSSSTSPSHSKPKVRALPPPTQHMRSL